MKKQYIVIIAVIVVLALGLGYVLLHNSNKSTTSAYSTTAPAATTTSSSKSQVALVNNAVLITKSNAAVGEYLADPSGNALYTYKSDTAGTSNCTGSCLANWPAYQDTGSTSGLPANVETITRADNGQVQYTYKGLPLYTFSGDSQGQVTGNGVANFEVARP